MGFSPETWVDGPGLKANSPIWRLSISTAYTALLSLALTLSIGPWNVLRGRPNPAHNPLRRDLGIWTAALGLAHMLVGMLVHTGGKYDLWALFAHGHPTPGNPLGLHLNFFGLGNLAGFFQAGLLLASVSLHGFSYQRIEERLLLFRALFWALVLAIAALQAAGFISRRRREGAKKPVSEV